jgi:hypothetical protein
MLSTFFPQPTSTTRCLLLNNIEDVTLDTAIAWDAMEPYEQGELLQSIGIAASAVQARTIESVLAAAIPLELLSTGERVYYTWIKIEQMEYLLLFQSIRRG